MLRRPLRVVQEITYRHLYLPEVLLKGCTICMPMQQGGGSGVAPVLGTAPLMPQIFMRQKIFWGRCFVTY